MTPACILVVEDDPAQREPLAGFLRSLGHDVRTAARNGEGRAQLGAGGVDVVVTDLRLPDADGLDLLRWARATHPGTDVVVVTAHGSVESAVLAMREGAEDFLEKPIDLGVLEHRLTRLLDRRQLARRVRALEDGLRDRLHAAGVVAESSQMQQVLAMVRRVAATNTTVLVTGESGTGKEVVSGLIHEWSARRSAPFVRVNCGALAETLLESDLFGHVRGAFTGADGERAGLFAEASGGTILLDEIGEISPALQVKLLRVLQEREVLPVGGTRPVRVDVRVVAATNRDLVREVREGRFRQDLLYRLNAITIAVPPLRERPEDVAALVPILLRRFADEAGVPARRLSREAHAALLSHPLPGNVRELQNLLCRATVLAGGDVIEAADVLPPGGASHDLAPNGAPADEIAIPRGSLPDFLDSIERRAMERALAACGGVQARAARSLGMHPRVFRYKMRLHGLETPEPGGS